VLLQILGAFEGLSAEVTFVRLQWDVDSDMGGDMITLDGGRAARVPAACEVQVVGALSPNVFFADMLLWC